MAGREESVESPEESSALRRAMQTISAMRAELDSYRVGSPIAVVGASVRLPGGVHTVGDFMEALYGGQELISDPPEDRKPFLDQESLKSAPSRGGYLHGALEFDAEFFGIAAREARSMDPQHRILLEVIWEAFEDAGIQVTDRPHSTGVYVGITSADYRKSVNERPPAHWTTGNGHCFAAGRIAYTLNFMGPTMAIDTACSSSLVAVHSACRALIGRECDRAVAAGVNLILATQSTVEIHKTGALSPSGRCRPFDARANGFVRGEGCGALVLKRYVDAVADGDHILAVLEGSAINQDGQSAGFAAPNPAAQASLIELTLSRAGRKAADVALLEAHGTGTALGDPIELTAVADSLGNSKGNWPLLVGSVKANIGHPEAAGGILGLIKAIECLRRDRVPPQANFTTLNPRVDLVGTRIAIPTSPTDLPSDANAVAMVNAFGMSGTNACVVVGRPPAPLERILTDAPGFVVSAPDDAGLAAVAAAYSATLTAEPSNQERFASFAWTATFGRTRLRHARWVAAGTAREAVSALDALASGEPDTRVRTIGADAEVPWTAPRSSLRGNVPTYPWRRKRYVPEWMS
ncbi:polyketide synthase [Kutzneria buriramensis]|uniref:beta-ketoacyl [acyl carrier protein] synthase domain-containing protein n=1 Tax=Kutzneria buriramensis TaxID=1045776 RepID=UPI0011C1782E|nr:polyketide synthase [Kutzneria buriramensis]